MHRAYQKYSEGVAKEKREKEFKAVAKWKAHVRAEEFKVYA